MYFFFHNAGLVWATFPGTEGLDHFNWEPLWTSLGLESYEIIAGYDKCSGLKDLPSCSVFSISYKLYKLHTYSEQIVPSKSVTSKTIRLSKVCILTKKRPLLKLSKLHRN